MDYLDTRIKELTTEQDEHLLRSSQPYGWPGLWRQMLGSRLGWSVRATLILVVLLVIAAIWTGVKFMAATDVLAALKYGLAFSTLVIIAVHLQIGMMPHVQSERVLRALKRVEILLLSRTQ